MSACEKKPAQAYTSLSARLLAGVNTAAEQSALRRELPRMELRNCACVEPQLTSPRLLAGGCHTAISGNRTAAQFPRGNCKNGLEFKGSNCTRGTP